MAYFIEIPVQLVGGATGHQRGVQVNETDQFKSICADHFTMTTAQVVCRMLGFSSG